MAIQLTYEKKVSSLKEIEIFHSLSEEVLESLASDCKEVHLKSGEILFSEGEPGDSMFVILSGSLSVKKKNLPIAEIGPGQYFGELALIKSTPRSATIKASQDANLLQIFKDHFDAYFASSPAVLMEVLKTVTGRAGDDLKALDKSLEKLQIQKKINSSLRELLNDTSSEIYTFDAISNHFLHMNSRLLKNLGYEERELCRLTPFDVIEGLTKDQLEELIEPLRQDQNKEMLFTGVHKRKDGSTYPVEVQFKLRNDENSQFFVGIIQDISQLKEMEAKFKNLISYDSLTGLPNRTLILEILDLALLRACEKNKSIGVLLVDVDDFKHVNDSLGHQAGDSLLQAVSQRLKKASPKKSAIARFGSDEFVIILSDIKHETEAAEFARNLLKSFQTSLAIEGHEFYITLSIGISYYPLDGHEAESLIKQADTAMHFAKSKGKNTYCHYSTDMALMAQNKLILERDLRKALEREEFELYYQPKMDLKSGIITGVEALLRWNHPQRGMVQPSDFIPLAEKYKLIVPMGKWVLKTACQQLKTWLSLSLPIRNVAVNLSLQQFSDPELVSTIAEIVLDTGIYPEYLELEITETILMQNLDTVVSKLHELNRMGVKISLDDFGTGYSSLGYLNSFPLNNLKIDRTFIKGICTEEDATIAKAIISLAKTLKLKTIAEGVETKEQKEVVHSLGCDYIQGYLLSKPLAEGDIIRLFSCGENASQSDPQFLSLPRKTVS